MKKLLIGVIAVYVVLNLTNFVIHQVLIGDAYQPLADAGIMRSEESMPMWIFFVTALVISFFFTLIFSKGYNGTGMGEGMRFGLYAGLLLMTPWAYDSYATYPIPYTLTLQWFLYGVVQYVILGIVASMVYGSTKGTAA